MRYRTRFDYDEVVSESHSELRACPVTDGFQRLIRYGVEVSPGAAVLGFVDAWGTRVDAFGVRRPHLAMEVVADAAVETAPRPLPAVTVALDRVAEPAFAAGHLEYLERGRHTRWGPSVADAARRQVDLAGPDVVSVALAIHRFVGSHLTYSPGATAIGVPVEEVLSRARGVCQDYAHLAVAMCRSVGVPARYVSGYLFDDAGTEPAPEVVTATTHAWFEAAIPGWGWLALDPTNGQPAGERHVKIGHGRDYDDVLPLRGAFIGPAGSVAHAVVELRRVTQHDPASTPAVTNEFDPSPGRRRGADQ